MTLCSRRSVQISQSHHQWLWFVNFQVSTFKIKYASWLHSWYFHFNLTNNSMHRLIELASYQGDPLMHILVNHGHLIYWMLSLVSWQVSWQFQVLQHSKNCFCPCSFFVPVPSPARAHRAQWHISFWAAVADHFQFWVQNCGAGELLPAKTWLPNTTA